MIIYIQTVGMLIERRRVHGQKQTPGGDDAAHSRTASKLFLEKGYEKTSLQDIIRETGTVTGSAHQLNHFFCRQRRASLPQTCHHTAHDR